MSDHDETVCPDCQGNDSTRPWCTLCQGKGRISAGDRRLWQPQRNGLAAVSAGGAARDDGDGGMNAPANAPRTALESPTRPAMAETATLPLPNPKNRQKRKTGAMQRDKGNRGETEFCRALGEHLGETLTRQLGAARDGGPDVLLGDRWAVEVKRGEALRLATWWQQACEQADKARRWPALAYRQNRQPWTVLVPLDIVMFGEAVWAWTVTDAHLDWAAAVSLAGFAAVVREANHE